MTGTGSWQTAEVGGPRQAAVVKKAEAAAAVIRRAKRPILVLGHRAGVIECNGGTMIDCLIGLARASGCTVVASGNASAALRKRDYTAHAAMPAVELGSRLTDPMWTGIDGKGTYDLVLLAGLPYPMAWTLLSALKHFSPIQTLSLDPGYQPQATWSLSNISIADWAAFMHALNESLRASEGGG